MTAASDTKSVLFTASDVERARQVICRAWDDIFPFGLTSLTINAGLSPAARRVLEAALTDSGRMNDLHAAALDYARYLTEGTEI
jgi:hypothetical protein